MKVEINLNLKRISSKIEDTKAEVGEGEVREAQTTPDTALETSE